MNLPKLPTETFRALRWCLRQEQGLTAQELVERATVAEIRRMVRVRIAAGRPVPPEIAQWIAERAASPLK